MGRTPWERLLKVIVYLCAGRVVCGAGQAHHDWTRTTAASLEARGYSMIPADLINRAALEIPRQADTGEDASWSCGPNSALRASMMLGRPAPDVNRFIGQSPRYNSFGHLANLMGRGTTGLVPFLLSPLCWVPLPGSIGPVPEGLRDYLKKWDNFGGGIGVRAARVDHWHEMVGHIRHSMNIRRPVIALLVWGQTSMHYVCVVGIHEGRGRAAILNTDGIIYDMPLEELHHQMDAGGTVPFKLDLFKGYNAVDFPW